MIDYHEFFARSLRDLSTSAYLTNGALTAPLTELMRPRFGHDVAALRRRLLTKQMTSDRTRIAIANVDMGVLAGSQLWTLDMARHLTRLGFETIVHTGAAGNLAKRGDAAGIVVTESIDEVVAFSPNIVQMHHYEAASELVEALGPGVARVNLVHGLLPWPGMPGLGGIQRYGAVSVAARAKIHVLSGTPWDDIDLVPNFFDPARFGSRSSAEPADQSALLFSNRTPTAVRDALRDHLARHDLSLDHIGKGGIVTPRPEEVLGRYKIVFAVGRSAIEAIAAGAQVILWDDGIIGPAVTPHNFWECVASNFALSPNMLPWTSIEAPTAREWLAEQLTLGTTRHEVSALVRSHLTIENVAPLLTDIHAKAMVVRRPASAAVCT